MKTIDQVYSPETLRRLQLVEYDILKKFDAMCKKYGLEYFAIYGTLLGAVRHQGIIPWDDDIDIGMPRKDYDRLVELVPQEFGDGYTFLDATTDPRYPFITGRIMKKGTEFRMMSAKNLPMELGIFLDIFVIENVPDDAKAQKVYLRNGWITEKLCCLRTMPFPNIPYRGLKRAIVRTACLAASLCLRVIPAKTLHSIRLKLATAYKDQHTNTLCMGTGIDWSRGMYTRDEIYPAKTMPYEDMMIPVPNDPNAMLTRMYGPNYMTPLPEGKRSCIIPYKLDFGDDSTDE